jgi:LAO/AO transport system kinase
VLDAADFDMILVETVGVGQSEVEIVRQADTTIVVVAPGMGDSVQAAKAGILEIADIFVVNKADRDGADEAVRQLRTATGFSDVPGGRKIPILKTVASQGIGTDTVTAAIGDHLRWLVHTGELAVRRRSRAAFEVEAIAVQSVRESFAGLRDVESAASLPGLAARVCDGELDPHAAAAILVSSLGRR